MKTHNRSDLVIARVFLPYLIGIIVFYEFRTSWGLTFLCILNLLISALLMSVKNDYFLRKFRHFKSTHAVLFYLMFFCMGGLFVVLNDETLKTDYYANKPAEKLKVIIDDEPQVKNKIIRFKALVSKGYNTSESTKYKDTPSLTSDNLSGTIIVSIQIDSLKPIQLKYGDELLIPAHFKSIPLPLHSATFDYKSWLAAQNVHHQIFLKQLEVHRLSEHHGNPLIAYALELRAEQVAFYRKIINNDEDFSIASTLILGYRAELSPETLNTYSATGTIHALSVSGMHVGMIYMVLNMLLNFMDRVRLLSIIKMIFLLSSIWFYSLLSGFSPSVLRSVIMLSILMLSKLFSRQNNSYNTLFITAFAMLIYDPFLVWDVGFQLSFMAVAGLVYLQPKLLSAWPIQNKWFNKLWGIIAMSISAQLFTFPASIYYFHIFPVYFLLGNLFIMLPMTILMYLGIIILLFRLSIAGPAFEWLIHFTNTGLSWIANLPLAIIPSIWINRTELTLLTLSLILFTTFWIYKKKHLLFASLVLFLCMQVYSIYKDLG